jgi:hypothetical protein
MITQCQISDNRIDLTVPHIGYVQLYRFSGEPGSFPAGKPWHIVTFGYFFATPEDCIKYLEEVSKNWNECDEVDNERSVCHAEMTHSFLATEADLDNCPY